MQQPFSTKNFPLGPNITIHFVPDENSEFKVQITPSERFSAALFVDMEASIYQNFLSWLSAYGKKEPPPLNFLPIRNIPFFQKTILHTLKTIPFGTTISYGDLALLSGHKRAARAVETVCRKNKLPLFIPCHRVIQSSGLIGDFAFGSPLKKILLEFEQST